MADAKTVDRLAAIKKQQDALKQESDQLQGELLKEAESDLLDTKRKTVSYAGTGGNRVTATMADSVKILYPAYLNRIFGLAAKDVLTETTSYKLSAPASRMLAGIYKNDYLCLTVSEVLEQLRLPADTTKVLRKKVRGINYEKDVAALLAIGGLSAADAEQTAFLVAEAAVWESFSQLMKVCGTDGAEKTSEIIQLIQAAIVVEETPKISVEVGE